MKLQNTMFNINKGPLCHTIELLKDDIVQVRIDFCLNRNAKPGDPPMSDHPLVNRLMPLIGLSWMLNQSTNKEAMAYAVTCLRECSKENLPEQGLYLDIFCLDDDNPTNECRAIVRGLSDSEITTTETSKPMFCGRQSCLADFGKLEEAKEAQRQFKDTPAD